MNSAIEAMLIKYNPQNNEERENAIKEIIQEIALAGLSRGGFFEKVAFYGGTCLRIFHGLNRFSEDLDFALLEKDPSFKLDSYFPYLEKEFLSYGIDVDIETKHKKGDKDMIDVQSAFLKGNTLTLMMSFFPKSEDAKKVISNQKTKIKFEIDVDNPAGGKTEMRYKTLPSPYEVKVFDESTLFAGKIHAILCREYKEHVKGRDYYDYLFYVGKGSRFNLEYLENKLKNTGKISEGINLTLDMVKNMLRDKLESVDYESAKKDVSNFIDRKDNLQFWKPELFVFTLNQLKPVIQLSIDPGASLDWSEFRNIIHKYGLTTTKEGKIAIDNIILTSYMQGDNVGFSVHGRIADINFAFIGKTASEKENALLFSHIKNCLFFTIIEKTFSLILCFHDRNYGVFDFDIKQIDSQFMLLSIEESEE